MFRLDIVHKANMNLFLQCSLKFTLNTVDWDLYSMNLIRFVHDLSVIYSNWIIVNASILPPKYNYLISLSNNDWPKLMMIDSPATAICFLNIVNQLKKLPDDEVERIAQFYFSILQPTWVKKFNFITLRLMC